MQKRKELSEVNRVAQYFFSCGFPMSCVFLQQFWNSHRLNVSVIDGAHAQIVYMRKFYDVIVRTNHNTHIRGGPHMWGLVLNKA